MTFSQSDPLFYCIDLTDLFQNHKFVGCVDQIRALVQHQVGTHTAYSYAGTVSMHASSYL